MNLCRNLARLTSLTHGGSTSKLSSCLQHVHQRPMFTMLNTVFNKPDRQRIKEVGPDRACAEWLLRCGAFVRWKDADKFNTDYNSLPAVGRGKPVIEEVDANEAAVMGIGFEHLIGCEHIKKMRFYKCMYLDNEAVKQLHHVKESLEILELTGSGNVTDKGLLSLVALEQLKQLVLHDLPEVRYKEKAYKALQSALPECEIRYIDLEETKKDGG